MFKCIQLIRQLRRLANPFFVFFVFTNLLLSACSDSTYRDDGVTNELATISIKVRDDIAKEIETKAPDNTTISNVHILVYNNKQELISKQYTTGSTITITTKAGKNCSIYAIANTNNPNFFNKDVCSTVSKLKTLLANNLTDTNGIYINGKYLLMSGSIDGINIIGGNTTQNVPGLVVKRLSAQINLRVTAANGQTITGYRICNLPNTSTLIHNPTPNEVVSTDGTIGPDGASNWFCGTLNNVNSTTFTSNFHMYENRRGGRITLIDGTGTQSNQQEKVKYAPTNATYVEIYTAKDNTTSKYIVYLGGDNCQNYCIKRNCNYTYNIIINATNTTDTRVTRTDNLTARLANCYMVAPRQAITINVNTKGNGSPQNNAGIPLTHNTASLGLVWQSTNGLISNISNVSNGAATITAGTTDGNAVIAAYDGPNGTGNILWSWHIWVTAYAPGESGTSAINGEVHYYSEAAVKVFSMDRNLGALINNDNNWYTSNSSYGMLYQWGRKDPFPGSVTPSPVEPTLYGKQNRVLQGSGPVSIGTSIANPGTFYGVGANPIDWNNATNNYLWGNGGAKTIFDPCPYGWKVPPTGVWSYFKTSGTTPNSTDRNIHGGFYYKYNASGQTTWYPAAGERHFSGGFLSGSGDVGAQWNSTVNSGPYYMDFWQNYVCVVFDSNYSFGRAQALSVRCVRE